jgi:hypothetical protein
MELTGGRNPAGPELTNGRAVGWAGVEGNDGVDEGMAGWDGVVNGTAVLWA